MGFNTQPPEGGWHGVGAILDAMLVSTHSRPKAAGSSIRARTSSCRFQHTAARRRLARQNGMKVSAQRVSTHSRPKAAGNAFFFSVLLNQVSTHSRPKAAGQLPYKSTWLCRFQHTAARRRLEPLSKALLHQVSQP